MKTRYYIASGYGDGKHPDILLFTAGETGKIEVADAIVQGSCPSFLCKMGDYVYAASELEEKAVITSYKICKSKIIRIADREFEGRGLCHLSAVGEYLYASCYRSGELYIADAKLNKITLCYRGSGKSHIHWSTPWDSETLYVTDLGEDQILKLQKERDASVFFIEKIPLKTGSGPRQILFSKDRKRAIVIHELDSTVSFGEGALWYEKLFAVNATGRNTASNYPGGACMNFGGQLFLANRGENTIAVFGNDHVLTGEWDCQGVWPRHLLFSDPDLLLVACERSNTINSFLWDGCGLEFKDSFTLEGASCVIKL